MYYLEYSLYFMSVCIFAMFCKNHDRSISELTARCRAKKEQLSYWIIALLRNFKLNWLAY